MRNSDFIQRTMILDGHPWRFDDRPYIFPIINTTKKRTLLLASRQVEKSTTVGGIMLANACKNAFHNYLYVAPTMTQSGVFGREKIDKVVLSSPLIRNNFHPGSKGWAVQEKTLRNRSNLYFRSAFNTADGVRGLTSDITFFDEVQDIQSDFLPIIEACSQHRLGHSFFYTGTPKTFDNTIHQLWEKSTQCEWAIKCLHCGHWNILSIDHVLLDKPGLWCTKCHDDINTLYGIWVSAISMTSQNNINSDGKRLQYTMLPSIYIDWIDLFKKMRTLDLATLYNEVFGVSYDYGTKPITRERLVSICEEKRSMWEELPANFPRGADLYAGVDWGTGAATTNKTGFTILTICWHDKANHKLKIIYCKKFAGNEIDPDYIIDFIAKKCQQFKVKAVGADHGYGWGMNERLAKTLGKLPPVARIQYAAINKYLVMDEAAVNYKANRTEVMTDVFNRLKAEDIVPFRWEEFIHFGEDYLNIYSEYKETNKIGKMRYDHVRPDDAFHSLVYAYLVYARLTGIKTTTRYNPVTDDQIS